MGCGWGSRTVSPGFHLNNQLTQALTSRYRDSRLQVDFERFVSCAAQLTCIFCERCSGGQGWQRGVRGCLPAALVGAQPALSTQATAAGSWREARGSSA